VATKKWTKIDKNVICHNSKKFARHIGFFSFFSIYIYFPYRYGALACLFVGVWVLPNNIQRDGRTLGKKDENY